MYYTWKDFNIGIDIEIQGIVFHITNCDNYTKDFLLSNGIELNLSECLSIDQISPDPVIKKKTTPSLFKIPTTDDKLRRFLEHQGMVLQFDCVLNDSENSSENLMTYKLLYYLEDGTIAIKELKENREGRYHFPMMIGRFKLPKNWKKQLSEFPSIFFKQTADTDMNFYTLTDLRIGETIFAYGRKFLLLDCDKFTRDYYEHVIKPPMPQPGTLEIQSFEKPKPKKCLPCYLGLGTPEDSVASYYNLIPKSPRKDIINTLINQNKYLRYGCIMDTALDQQRNFILMYSLANHTIQIVEVASANSGIQGGRFLCPMKLIKRGSNPHDPIYYTAKDLCIGATIHVFSHRFKITSADLYVYRYMQSNPEKFSSANIQSVRNYLLLQGHLKEELSETIKKKKDVLDQTSKNFINDESTDIENVLQNLTNKEDPQNVLVSVRAIDGERLKPQPNKDLHVCLNNIITETEKREGYHETIDKEFSINLKQRNNPTFDSKTVRFNNESYIENNKMM